MYDVGRLGLVWCIERVRTGYKHKLMIFNTCMMYDV